MSRRSRTPDDQVISSSGLNLSVLQRLDPRTQEILATAPNAVLFQLDSQNQWSHMNVQGSFFVVKRNAPQRFQFIIMNRINTENLVEDILEIREYDIKLPYLTYTNKDNVSRSIFFDKPEFCEDICKVLQRISTAFGKVSPKPKLSSYKSDLAKPVVDPSSEVIKGLPSVSAVGSESAAENSLLSTLVNQGTTASANPGTFALCTSAVGPLDLQKMHHQQSMPATQPIPFPGFPLLSSAPHQNYPPFPVSPSDFYFLQNASSPMNFAPITVDSIIASPQHGITLPTTLPLLNPSYFSTPNFNPSQNLSNAPSISKEKIREAFMRLALNESFVEMLYQEVLRTHHQ